MTKVVSNATVDLYLAYLRAAAARYPIRMNLSSKIKTTGDIPGGLGLSRLAYAGSFMSRPMW